MATYPTAGQGSATYVLTSPRGNRAVFNDSADTDFVGYLDGDEAVTGLDSPEVRTTTYDLVEQDGAIPSPSYESARPITFNGLIIPTAGSVANRNARETQLKQVVNECRRGDGLLTWAPTGGIGQQLAVRRNQRLQIKGGFNKNFLVSLVAPNPRIVSQTLKSKSDVVGNSFALVNDGSEDALPELIRLYGPGEGLRARLGSVDFDYFKLEGTTLGSAELAEINVINHTVVKRNQILANDFESAITGWGTAGGYRINTGATLTNSAAQSYSGTKSLQIVTSGASNLQGADYAGVLSFTAGRTYTVEGWVYGTAGQVQLIAGDGTNLPGTPSAVTTLSAGAGWQLLRVTVTADATGTSGVAFRQNEAANPARTFWVDNVRVIDDSTNAGNLYRYVDHANFNDVWPTLQPGSTTVRGQSDSGSGALTGIRVDHRDTWL